MLRPPRSPLFPYTTLFRSAKGVVHYQWNAVAGSHLAQGLKIRNVETGIANGFDVQCLGFFINKRLKIGRIVAGHKFHLNAQSLKLHLRSEERRVGKESVS